MATVMREDGWVFVIYSDDHPPPHVHAKKAGGEVKVSLPTANEYLRVLRVRGVATHEAMRAARLVEEHRERLLREWEKIHG
jgi:Mn-dependent DtxR family transcriptional regulator